MPRSSISTFGRALKRRRHLHLLGPSLASAVFATTALVSVPVHAQGHPDLRVFFAPGVASVAFAVEQPQNPPIDSQVRQWGLGAELGVEIKMTPLLAVEFLAQGQRLRLHNEDGTEVPFEPTVLAASLRYAIDSTDRHPKDRWAVVPAIGLGVGYLDWPQTPPAPRLPAALLSGSLRFWPRHWFFFGVQARYLAAFGTTIDDPATASFSFCLGTSISGLATLH